MNSARTTTAWLLAAAGALALAPPARGDSIRLKNGLVYEPATVKAVADGVISFRLARGLVDKSLSEVAVIQITGDDDFNRAETLVKEGKHAAAIAAYKSAENRAGVDWKRTLVRYRLLAAAEVSGDIETAVTHWLAMMDQTKGSRGSLAMCPRKFPPKGSAGNDRAINLLEAKARLVKGNRYLSAVRQLLVGLYERQGRLADARAVAALLAGGTRPPTTKAGNDGPGPQTRPTPIRPGGSTQANLRLARLSLRSKRHREVVQRIEPLLQAFPEAELPAALYVLGAAQVRLAAGESDAAKARALLVSGGLNLMRVVALFPGSEDVPDALLLAGRANERLKNPDGARAAYTELIGRHGKAPAAKEGAKALKALGEGG